MKKIFSSLLLLTVVLTMQAQMADPIHFTTKLHPLKGAEAELLFTATIDAGWHVYSTSLGSDGPISATFHSVKMEGAEAVGGLKTRGKEIKKFDDMFGMELRYFEQAVTFVQKIKFTREDYDIDCYVEYGACNDQMCLPPSEATLKVKGKSSVAEEKKEEAAEKKEEAVDQVETKGSNEQLPDSSITNVVSSDSLGLSQSSSDSNALWQPVISELQEMGGSNEGANHTLLYILLMGFVGGLLAVCMPCIWPIIPMTVSFFLKRAKTDKRKGLRDAITYGASIIVIYLGLGLLVTALFGSDTLNAMSTNAVFNIFLFLLLVVFALSFFGWFEIKLPDSWANSVDTKASQASGLLSIFLMAFTLVLVSFSCTAPIIGLLLVETTTSGNWLAPALGMFGFALALALPFTLFALFPTWLKQAPKSGSWMNTIKVVLGFIELAFALKFFSVADLAYGWHLLDREVFLSLWIVIFALLGAYLCGWLVFKSDEALSEGEGIGRERGRGMPVVCVMGGLVSLAFAVYMVPGLWGAPCKAVSAFAPPMNTQDFNLNTKVVEAHYTDYEQGMSAARAAGKPVLIDFTGFGCVNCRKMESSVWTDPQVASLLTRDVVLISLYVDDKTPLAVPIDVTDAQGNVRTLRTVGAKWSYLQSHKFGANAQPYYVMINPTTSKPLTGSRAYNEDVAEYVRFLKQGISNYASSR